MKVSRKVIYDIKSWDPAQRGGYDQSRSRIWSFYLLRNIFSVSTIYQRIIEGRCSYLHNGKNFAGALLRLKFSSWRIQMRGQKRSYFAGKVRISSLYRYKRYIFFWYSCVIRREDLSPFFFLTSFFCQPQIHAGTAICDQSWCRAGVARSREDPMLLDEHCFLF